MADKMDPATAIGQLEGWQKSDAKEAITKTYASGSLYIGSYVEAVRYRKDPVTGKTMLDPQTDQPIPTTGYREILERVSEHRAPTHLFGDDSVIFL